MFADDTKLYRERTSDEDLTAVQEDMRKLEDWSKDWILPLNENKCHHMCLSKQVPTSDTVIYLHGNELKEVNEEIDLGITIDSKLSFHTHVKSKIKKQTQSWAS